MKTAIFIGLMNILLEDNDLQEMSLISKTFQNSIRKSNWIFNITSRRFLLQNYILKMHV